MHGRPVGCDAPGVPCRQVLAGAVGRSWSAARDVPTPVAGRWVCSPRAGTRHRAADPWGGAGLPVAGHVRPDPVRLSAGRAGRHRRGPHGSRPDRGGARRRPLAAGGPERPRVRRHRVARRWRPSCCSCPRLPGWCPSSRVGDRRRCCRRPRRRTRGSWPCSRRVSSPASASPAGVSATARRGAGAFWWAPRLGWLPPSWPATAFATAAVVNELSLGDRSAISSRFGPTDPTLEPPPCDGALSAGPTAYLTLQMDDLGGRDASAARRRSPAPGPGSTSMGRLRGRGPDLRPERVRPGGQLGVVADARGAVDTLPRPRSRAWTSTANSSSRP